MCSQSRCSEPADIDGAEAERGSLHAQLQCHGPSQPMELALALACEAALGEVEAVRLVVSGEVEHACHEDELQDPAQQSRKSCAEQPHLRQSAMPEDEHPVANDVEHVAHKHNPHRRGRVLYAVAELLVGIEHHHGQQAQHQHNQIRADQGQQLHRQSEPRQRHQQHSGKQHQQQPHHRAGEESVLQLAGDVVRPALTQQSSHHGRNSVGEAHASDDEQPEHIVHEAGSCQLLSAVASDHKRIGEPHHDGAQLAHHNRHADAQEVGIVG